MVIGKPTLCHRIRTRLASSGDIANRDDGLLPAFQRSNFHSWTEDNWLRQVVYEGLSEDKPAAETRRLCQSGCNEDSRALRGRGQVSIATGTGVTGLARILQRTIRVGFLPASAGSGVGVGVSRRGPEDGFAPGRLDQSRGIPEMRWYSASSSS
jgi:hypothetical protein